MLNLVISSVAGSLQMGASLLAFCMEMNISFSCTSGEVAGLGGVEQECEGGLQAAEAYSEQQNRSHVWEIWIVHIIEGQIKCVKLYKYLPTFPIIPPI